MKSKLIGHLTLFFLLGLATYFLAKNDDAQPLQEHTSGQPQPQRLSSSQTRTNPHGILGFLSRPWWDGISALLSVVTALMATVLTILLFQAQQSASISNIDFNSVFYTSSSTSISENAPWEARLIILNQGPSVAEFVKLSIAIGSSYFHVVNNKDIGVQPSGIVKLVSVKNYAMYGTVGLDEGNIIIGYPYKGTSSICEYTFEINRWQVNEYITLLFSFEITKVGREDIKDLPLISPNIHDAYTEVSSPLFQPWYLYRYRLYENSKIKSSSDFYNRRIDPLGVRLTNGREGSTSCPVNMSPIQ
jgi:hypothetical protein